MINLASKLNSNLAFGFRYQTIFRRKAILYAESRGSRKVGEDDEFWVLNFE